MSDQQDNTMTWMELAKYTANTLGIEPEIAGALVMEWVISINKRDPDFSRMAIPHSNIDKFIDLAGVIYKARHGEPTEREETERHNVPVMEESHHLMATGAYDSPTPSMYDPDGELERVELKIIAGDSDAVAYTNDSVKRFFEKRLLLAWTALKSTEHLEDEAPADVLGRQDVLASPLDIIGICVEEMWGLDRVLSSEKSVVI